MHLFLNLIHIGAHCVRIKSKNIKWDMEKWQNDRFELLNVAVSFISKKCCIILPLQKISRHDTEEKCKQILPVPFEHKKFNFHFYNFCF